MGADGFDPGTSNAEVDHIAIGPEADRDAGVGGSEPELFAPHGQVARGRHHPIEFHRPTVIDHRSDGAVGFLPHRIDCLHRFHWGGWGRGGDGGGLRCAGRLEVGRQPQR
jgi:hypothetical protein